MKRRFTILTAALALLTFLAVPLGMRGQTTVEVTLSSGTFNNNVITWTCADGNITIQQLKGSGSSNPNSSYIGAPRVYKQNILSFVGNNGYTITNIDIKCDGSYYGTTKYAGTEISNNNVENNTALNPTWSTANGGTHTIATVSSDGLSEIYVQNGHSSDSNSQLRITKITITYKVTAGATATTVTINSTGLTNTDIYTSTSAGTLSASVTETESGNVISGATVAWTSSDTDVATIDNSGAVTLVAVGTTTITASYAGESGVYGASSATYELTVTSSEPYVQPTTIEIIPNYTFWGKTGQFSGSDNDELSGSQDNVTLDWSRGNGSTYANMSAMRFYKDNTLVFTAPTGYEIISIVITFTSTTYAPNDIAFSPTGYELDGTTGTWTGSSETVTMSRPSSASSYAQISKFTITLAEIGGAVATTTTINVPANFNTDIYTSTTAGTLTATVTENVDNTAISGTTVTWSSSNTAVATIDANGVVTLVAVGTSTITASYAGVEDVYRPSEATYELNITSSEPIPGTETDPYTVAEAITFIDGLGGETSAEVYVTGIISQIDSYNSSYHSITYWISDDGTTTSQLEVYSGKGLNGANFNSINDLIVGSTVTVKGNLKKYNDVYEFNYNSVIVSLTPPAKYTLTAAMTNVAEYFVFVGDDAIEFDENNQAQVTAGSTVFVSLTMEDCYVLTSLTVNGSTTGVTEEEPGVYYSFVMPEGDATIGVSATQATQYTLTVVGTENVSFDMLAGAESDPVTLTNGTASICEQSNVVIANLTANSGLIVQSVTLTAGNNTTTLTPEYGVYQFNMPSSNATLTFTTTTAPTYTLATSIESGKQYIIVGQGDGDYYAMGEDKGNNRNAYGITLNGTTATATVASGYNVHEFTISSLATPGYYSICDAIEPGYLYAGSSNGNQLKTEAELDSNHNGDWEIIINAETGVASVVASQSNNRNVMQFNSSSSNKLFNCYSSASQHPVYLYVKDETPATETYTLTVDAYTNDNTKDGYNLIASPVKVDPATVAGMTEGDFDLYSFDESQADEWRNYEATAFNLVPGKGYLYAKKATTENPTYTFQLTGTPYAGNGTIDLDYDANAEFPGFNLIGNPFGTNANLDLPYYRLNSDGSALNTSTESTQVLVMEGVFVEATSTIRTATFSPAAKRVSQLNVKVTRNRGAVLDNAIIRFDNGAVLGKFQLNPNSTKLYITEGNQDYAVVRSNNEGEMPVSFKAAENGNYTLSIEAENVEASYLHLIDNMTGADVDLLATPSYSFDARTTDHENRFRLVFNANGVEENTMSNFAYFNGSSWTVNNMGEATLQVVDVMGRVLSTETISGNTEVNLNQAAGVYMLRLVTGNDVKVQKVVVR